MRTHETRNVIFELAFGPILNTFFHYFDFIYEDESFEFTQMPRRTRSAAALPWTSAWLWRSGWAEC